MPRTSMIYPRVTNGRQNLTRGSRVSFWLNPTRPNSQMGMVASSGNGRPIGLSPGTYIVAVESGGRLFSMGSVAVPSGRVIMDFDLKRGAMIRFRRSARRRAQRRGRLRGFGQAEEVIEEEIVTAPPATRNTLQTAVVVGALGFLGFGLFYGLTKKGVSGTRYFRGAI